MSKPRPPRAVAIDLGARPPESAQMQRTAVGRFDITGAMHTT
jgi:hypothetical protein